MKLNLTSTHISLCLPETVEVKKLKYFAAPPNGDINASGTIRAVVELVDARLYMLWTARKAIPNGEHFTQIVQANPRLIPG